MISQSGLGIKNGNIPLQYDALKICLREVAREAKIMKSSIHMLKLW